MEEEMVEAQLHGLTGSNISHNRLLSNLQHSLAHLAHLESLHPSSSPSDTNDNKPQEEELVEAMRDVAQQQWKLGSLDKALHTQTKILQNSTSLLPNPSDDCGEVAKTMHEIGRIHLRIGNYPECQRWLESALEMKRRLYNNGLLVGGDGSGSGSSVRHREIGRTLNALALLHLRVLSSGMIEEEEEDDESVHVALSLMQEAESHYRHHGTTTDLTDPSDVPQNTLNSDHPDLAGICENMAMLHRRNQRDLSTALDQYEEALRIRETMRKAATSSGGCSEEEMKIVGLLMDIGDCLGGGGKGGLERYSEAVERYKEALNVHATMVRRERLEATMEAHHRNTYTNDIVPTGRNSLTNPTGEVGTSVEGVIRHNIGNVHAQKAEFDQALDEYEIALSIKKKLVGEDHPEVALTLNAIGALMASNRTEAPSSLPYFREALRIYRLHSSSPAVVQVGVDNVWSVDGDGDGGGGLEDERVAKILENIRLVEKNLGMSLPDNMGDATHGSRF